MSIGDKLESNREAAMVGVTPVGIITNKMAESRHFYGNVMAIERVQVLRRLRTENVDGAVMRLESPQIELLETEMKVLERSANQTVRCDFRMIVHPRDTGGLFFRLAQEGIVPRARRHGGFEFDDLNGISWEIKSGLSEMNFDDPAKGKASLSSRPS